MNCLELSLKFLRICGRLFVCQLSGLLFEVVVNFMTIGES